MPAFKALHYALGAVGRVIGLFLRPLTAVLSLVLLEILGDASMGACLASEKIVDIFSEPRILSDDIGE